MAMRFSNSQGEIVEIRTRTKREAYSKSDKTNNQEYLRVTEYNPQILRGRCFP